MKLTFCFLWFLFRNVTIWILYVDGWWYGDSFFRHEAAQLSYKMYQNEWAQNENALHTHQPSFFFILKMRVTQVFFLKRNRKWKTINMQRLNIVKEMEELKLMWFMLRDLRWKAIGVHHGIKMKNSFFCISSAVSPDVSD